MHRKWSAHCAALLLVAASSAACGGATEQSGAADAGPPASAKAEPPPSHPTSATICQPGLLDVHKDALGRVDRIHARVDALGKKGPFLVDTGTSRTFALRTTPEDAYNTPAVIGCRSTVIPVFDRREIGTTPDGEPQSGRLGRDLLTRGAYDLDLRGSKFMWTESVPEPPPGATAVPLESRQGWLVASIVVDGRPKKVVLDTGAHNVLLMSAIPRPGESVVAGIDGTGIPVMLYEADGEVSLGGEPARRLPVDRASSFPTLEKLIVELGPDVEGLLGLSALGDERIILSPGSLVVVL